MSKRWRNIHSCLPPFFPPSVPLSPPAPLCHLIGSNTHTHTHTQHFASTGVMSAGAQHGAACCYGDRRAPSDQQLLTCSYHLSFISFSSPLLSPPLLLLLLLLTTSLSSFSPFNHSFTSQPFLPSTHLSIGSVNTGLECQSRKAPDGCWQLKVGYEHIVTGHTCLRAHEHKRTLTHIHPLILFMNWTFHVAIMCLPVCSCALECAQACVCLTRLRLPSDMFSQQFRKDWQNASGI